MVHRSNVRNEDEPIADLDFASMFPHLAYRHVRKEPPEGDLYAIPGLEDHRKGAKAGLSALLSYSSEMQSLPSRFKAELPEGWTASKLKAAMAAHHPHLVPLFGNDMGLDFMFTESRILLAALQRLMKKRIPALPMHNGLMVPVSRKGEGMEVMRQASIAILGGELAVDMKEIVNTT